MILLTRGTDLNWSKFVEKNHDYYHYYSTINFTDLVITKKREIIVSVQLKIISLYSFSIDPTHRTTLWVFLIGGVFQMLPVYATNQTAVQRFLTSKSFKSAQRYIPVTF